MFTCSRLRGCKRLLPLRGLLGILLSLSVDVQNFHIFICPFLPLLPVLLVSWGGSRKRRGSGPQLRGSFWRWANRTQNAKSPKVHAS